MRHKPFIIMLLALCVGVLGAVYAHKALPGFGSDAPSFDAIVDLPPDDPAVLEYWMEMIETEGGEAAYRHFDEVYADLDVSEQHARAHAFGEALYKVDGISGIATCNANYGFGCYHAFFGWALTKNGLDILDELDQACIEAYGPKGLGCQHGIGHGVIAELGYDELNPSLDACARLDWQGPIGGCTSGVFMEYNFETMQQTGMRDIDERGSYHPCTVVEGRFTQACYFEQPAWWNAHYQDDYVRIGELCDGVADRLDREACFRGTGNVIAGLGGYEIPEILEHCGTMPDRESEMLCIEGAVWITSNQPKFGNDWKQLCESLKGEYYERCIASHDFI